MNDDDDDVIKNNKFHTSFFKNSFYGHLKLFETFFSCLEDDFFI